MSSKLIERVLVEDIDFNSLSEGQIRGFYKRKDRSYPTGLNILLSDLNKNILAFVEIISPETHRLIGFYKVSRALDEIGRKILTKGAEDYWFSKN